MLYVGVDVAVKESQIAVMDEAGQVLQRRRVSTSRAAIHAALTGYAQPLKATLEASYHGGPVCDWLAEVADEVVLAHPLKVRAIAEARIKTDAIDAATLAHLLRANLIPPPMRHRQRSGRSNGSCGSGCSSCGCGRCSRTGFMRC